MLRRVSETPVYEADPADIRYKGLSVLVHVGMAFGILYLGLFCISIPVGGLYPPDQGQTMTNFQLGFLIFAISIAILLAPRFLVVVYNHNQVADMRLMRQALRRHLRSSWMPLRRLSGAQPYREIELETPG